MAAVFNKVDDAPPPHAARDLTEDIHKEILLRLPAESILRCRAVCKAWRRITTDPRFIADHERRRPTQPVVYTYLVDESPCSNHPAAGCPSDIALDVVPFVSDESSSSAVRRRLIRYPKFEAAAGPDEDDPPAEEPEPDDEPLLVRRRRRGGLTMHCLMLASCDGVLLFKKDPGVYLLCNPITMRWAALPRPDALFCATHDVEYAFYFDQPSGEYRLLLCRRLVSEEEPGWNWTWCVLSTGAAEPRQVDTHAVACPVPSLMSTASPPAPLHGRLHWPPRRQKGTTTTAVVTFDTASETFQSMTGPPATTTRALTKLFVMDGRVAVADFGYWDHVDLWFLEDYGAERWERRHRVATPRGPDWGMPYPDQPSTLLSVAALADDQGNVMLGNHHSLVVYNVRTRIVTRVNSMATPKNNVLMSRHVFRENLAQLPGFKAATADLPLIHFWH
jgi:F-box interacting protein